MQDSQLTAEKRCSHNKIIVTGKAKKLILFCIAAWYFFSMDPQNKKGAKLI